MSVVPTFSFLILQGRRSWVGSWWSRVFRVRIPGGRAHSGDYSRADDKENRSHYREACSLGSPRPLMITDLRPAAGLTSRDPGRARQGVRLGWDLERTPTQSSRNPPAVRRRRGAYSPAIVIRSMSQDPVRVLPGKSQSLPTASRPSNMRLRLPATVISSTGNWISPFSTQKPEAPRE